MAKPHSIHRVIKGQLKRITSFQNVPDRDNKTTSTVDVLVVDETTLKNQPLPLRELMIPPVLIAALNYACLALVDISTRAVQPVFFSTPVELGGLGLPPHHIGKILAVYGILNGFLQIFFFAKTQARFGAKNTYMAGIASSLLTFISFPIISALARKGEDAQWFVWFAVGCQVVTSLPINFSYGKTSSHHGVLCAADRCYSYRERLHLHHRIRAEPRIIRLRQRPGTAQRLDRPCSGSCCGELAVFAINRPEPSLPRWKSGVLGADGAGMLRARGGLLPPVPRAPGCQGRTGGGVTNSRYHEHFPHFHSYLFCSYHQLHRFVAIHRVRELVLACDFPVQDRVSDMRFGGVRGSSSRGWVAFLDPFRKANQRFLELVVVGAW